MAISLIGFGTTSHNAISAQTYNFSSLTDISGAGSVTLQQNDLILVWYVHSGTGTRTLAQCTPSGYSNPPSETVATSSDTDVASAGFSYKFMTASPDASVAIPACAATTNSCSVVIFVYRGVDTVTPFAGVTPVNATAINGAKPDPASITTPASPLGCVIVGGMGQAQATGAALTAPTTTAYDATANYVKAANNTAQTNDSAALIGNKTGVAVNTAFNASAANGGTTANTDAAVSQTLVLQPAPTAASIAGSGTGALTVTGGMVSPSALSASGTSTFPGVGSSSTLASGALSAAGTAATSIVDSVLATAALSAAGTASEAATGQATAAATLSGSAVGASSPAGRATAQASVSGATAGATSPAGTGITQSAVAMAATAALAPDGRALASSAVAASGAGLSAPAGQSTVAGAVTGSGNATSSASGAATAASALSGSAAGMNAGAGAAVAASGMSGASAGAVDGQAGTIAAASLSASGVAAANDNAAMIGSGGLSGNGSSVMAGDSTVGDVIASGSMSASCSGAVVPNGTAYATGASLSAGFGLVVGEGASIAQASLTASGSGFVAERNAVGYPVPDWRKIANDPEVRAAAGTRTRRSVTGPARSDRSIAPNLQRRGGP